LDTEVPYNTEFE